MFFFRQRDREPQHFSFEMHIRVRKDQPFPGGMLECLLQRMRFAEPAGRKGRDRYNLQPRVFARRVLQNAFRRIFGTIVHSDHFVFWVIQRQKRIQRTRQFLGFVTRRKQNGHARAVRILQRRNARQCGNRERPKCQINGLYEPNKCNRVPGIRSRTSAKWNILQRVAREHAMLSLGMARSVSIVGAGRLGRTLGRNLRRLGWRIGAVVTRSNATARAAVRTIGAGKPHSTLTRDAMDADVILLVTPDGALADVARELASLAGKSCRGKVVLHASGALDSSVLRPLARCGAAIGSIHPMQTFTTNSQPNLNGVIFAIEGDARARRTAATIARALGGVPVPVASRNKPAYHAAGTMLAGHALALTESATQVLTKIGFSREHAVQTLLPLMRQMLGQFRKARTSCRVDWPRRTRRLRDCRKTLQRIAPLSARIRRFICIARAAVGAGAFQESFQDFETA